jgi:hypothetical protein
MDRRNAVFANFQITVGNKTCEVDKAGVSLFIKNPIYSISNFGPNVQIMSMKTKSLPLETSYRLNLQIYIKRIQE